MAIHFYEKELTSTTQVNVSYSLQMHSEKEHMPENRSSHYQMSFIPPKMILYIREPVQ